MTPYEFYAIGSPRQKIQAVPAVCARALLSAASFKLTFEPARDCVVLPVRSLPGRIGLATAEGQARLLHDLANIELQAMELAVRTLVEYGDAPVQFRVELAALAQSEASHLELCLNAIEELGFRWGDWPVHLVLWQAVRAEDTLLERLLIVHRYLEGSGLDAGEAILQRLSGVNAPAVRGVVSTIVAEEVDHVLFGSRWFREICMLENLDAAAEFSAVMQRLAVSIPKREKLAYELRRRAGFSSGELEVLEVLRN